MKKELEAGIAESDQDEPEMTIIERRSKTETEKRKDLSMDTSDDHIDEKPTKKLKSDRSEGSESYLSQESCNMENLCRNLNENLSGSEKLHTIINIEESTGPDSSELSKLEHEITPDPGSEQEPTDPRPSTQKSKITDFFSPKS